MEEENNNFYNRFKKFCDSNISVIVTIVGIITVLDIAYRILKSAGLNFGFATSLLSGIFTFFNYKLPLYLTLLIVFLTYLFAIKRRDRYKKPQITFDFLVGKWINEWDINGQHPGKEELEILKDGGYFRNGEHIFNVEKFKYDDQLNQISFVKASARPPEIDNRKVKNVLNVVSNDMLYGTEDNYLIRYSRIK